MAPERRDLVSNLYHRALERTPDERPVFLQQACEGDGAVRQEVESLLAYASSAAPFLETPAAEVVAGGFAGGVETG